MYKLVHWDLISGKQGVKRMVPWGLGPDRLAWLSSPAPCPPPGTEQGLLICFLGVKTQVLKNEQVIGKHGSEVA